ncbi:hypothetical protein D3C80_554830 [compost metagenome]
MRVEGIAHAQAQRFRQRQFDGLRVAAGRQQHAGQRGAGLAGVDHHVLHAVAHRRCQVGILGDQQRRLAAQFQAHALD